MGEGCPCTSIKMTCDIYIDGPQKRQGARHFLRPRKLFHWLHCPPWRGNYLIVVAYTQATAENSRLTGSIRLRSRGQIKVPRMRRTDTVPPHVHMLGSRHQPGRHGGPLYVSTLYASLLLSTNIVVRLSPSS